MSAVPRIFRTILASVGVSLVGVNAMVLAQSPNDFMRMFGGIVQQGMIQAAISEWRKLSSNEITCIDQSLRQQDLSVDALANRGVYPSDPRLAQLRFNCGGQVVQKSVPGDASISPYVVDGLALGARVVF